MNVKALGIIETVGFVPAVEAGDVAVKTADVTIIGSQCVGGGLVSILMRGDVSAVRAAVDAASSAASRLGEVRSISVIARTAEGLDAILIKEDKRPGFVTGQKIPNAGKPEVGPLPEEIPQERSKPVPAKAPVPASTAVSQKPVVEISETDTDDSDAGKDEPLILDMEDLKKLKVTKLRRLAGQIPVFSIPNGEIKYARKNNLLGAFIQYMKTIEK